LPPPVSAAFINIGHSITPVLALHNTGRWLALENTGRWLADSAYWHF
jgi:hypothetical protein